MATVPKRPVHTELIDDPAFAGGPFVLMKEASEHPDHRPVFLQIEQDLAADHAGYFAGDVSPAGEGWLPLSSKTVAKKGHATILVENGDMRLSVVDPAAPGHVSDVHETHLVFGTSDPKALYHQRGTSRIPARPFVGVTEQRVDAIANVIADSTVEQLKG